MATVKQRFQIEDQEYDELTQDFSVAGSTDWMRLQGDIGVQITGTATSCTAIVERSIASNPSAATAAPAEDDPFSGNLSLGFAARAYREPVRAWWRVRISALSGGDAQVHIVGQQG